MEHEYTVSFLTFGGGAGKFRCAVRRICREARNLCLFHTVTGYTDNDLKRDFPDFWTKHGAFIEANPRGYGYWLWKPFLMLHRLNEMREGDILLYADAGCELNPYGRPRLLEYFALCAEHSVLTFNLGGVIKDWTKMDTILRLDPELQTIERPQHAAGVVVLKKTLDTVNMVEEWVAVATEDNFHYVDDSESVAPNDKNYQEHRHDQAIVSLVLVKHGLDFCLPHGEIWVSPKRWHRDGAQCPVWASRNLGGVVSLPMLRLQIEKADSDLQKALLYAKYVCVQFSIQVMRARAGYLLRRLGLRR